MPNNMRTPIYGQPGVAPMSNDADRIKKLDVNSIHAALPSSSPHAARTRMTPQGNQYITDGRLRIPVGNANQNNPIVPQFQGPRIAMVGRQRYDLGDPAQKAQWEQASRAIRRPTITPPPQALANVASTPPAVQRPPMAAAPPVAAANIVPAGGYYPTMPAAPPVQAPAAQSAALSRAGAVMGAGAAGIGPRASAVPTAAAANNFSGGADMRYLPSADARAFGQMLGSLGPAAGAVGIGGLAAAQPMIAQIMRKLGLNPEQGSVDPNFSPNWADDPRMKELANRLGGNPNQIPQFGVPGSSSNWTADPRMRALQSALGAGSTAENVDPGMSPPALQLPPQNTEKPVNSLGRDVTHMATDVLGPGIHNPAWLPNMMGATTGSAPADAAIFGSLVGALPAGSALTGTAALNPGTAGAIAGQVGRFFPTLAGAGAGTGAAAGYGAYAGGQALKDTYDLATGGVNRRDWEHGGIQQRSVPGAIYSGLKNPGLATASTAANISGDLTRGELPLGIENARQSYRGAGLDQSIAQNQAQRAAARRSRLAQNEGRGEDFADERTALKREREENARSFGGRVNSLMNWFGL